MVGSSGEFSFDGDVVCASFLIQAFPFSLDLQFSVRYNLIVIPPVRVDSEQEAARISSDDNDDERIDIQSRGKGAVITFLERLADDTG